MFLLYFDQINAALVSIRNFSKTLSFFTLLDIPKRTHGSKWSSRFLKLKRKGNNVLKKTTTLYINMQPTKKATEWLDSIRFQKSTYSLQWMLLCDICSLKQQGCHSTVMVLTDWRDLQVRKQAFWNITPIHTDSFYYKTGYSRARWRKLIFML